jgi:hypothetical protein
MKKRILFFAAIFIVANGITSCSTATDEKVEVQTPAALLVEKSARMLHFETSLKQWFETRNETSSDALKKQAVAEIQIEARALLAEIGTSQSIIDTKTNADDLVLFTLDEYSRKLSAMSNPNNK